MGRKFGCAHFAFDRFRGECATEHKETLPKEITELTNGSAGLEWGKTCVYALIDKEVVFF